MCATGVFDLVEHDLIHMVKSIVFVHGLTGDREKTWTYPGASDPWLKTLLPSVLPNARIVAFGYDAYVTRWTWGGRVSHNRIGNHASNLLASLTTFREQNDQNKPPIIFVCHSLGGIVCMDVRQQPDVAMHVRVLTATGRRPWSSREIHLTRTSKISSDQPVLLPFSEHHIAALDSLSQLDSSPA